MTDFSPLASHSSVYLSQSHHLLWPQTRVPNGNNVPAPHKRAGLSSCPPSPSAFRPPTLQQQPPSLQHHHRPLSGTYTSPHHAYSASFHHPPNLCHQKQTTNAITRLLNERYPQVEESLWNPLLDSPADEPARKPSRPPPLAPLELDADKILAEMLEDLQRRTVACQDHQDPSPRAPLSAPPLYSQRGPVARPEPHKWRAGATQRAAVDPDVTSSNEELSSIALREEGVVVVEPEVEAIKKRVALVYEQEKKRNLEIQNKRKIKHIRDQLARFQELRHDAIANISEIKQTVSELESQQMEIMRHVELERGRLKEDFRKERSHIETLQRTISTQEKQHMEKIEALFKEQEQLAAQMDKEKAKLDDLELQHREILSLKRNGDAGVANTIKKLEEQIDQQRKIYEDLEFQQLEDQVCLDEENECDQLDEDLVTKKADLVAQLSSLKTEETSLNHTAAVQLDQLESARAGLLGQLTGEEATLTAADSEIRRLREEMMGLRGRPGEGKAPVAVCLGEEDQRSGSSLSDKSDYDNDHAFLQDGFDSDSMGAIEEEFQTDPPPKPEERFLINNNDSLHTKEKQDPVLAHSRPKSPYTNVPLVNGEPRGEPSSDQAVLRNKPTPPQRLSSASPLPLNPLSNGNQDNSSQASIETSSARYSTSSQHMKVRTNGAEVRHSNGNQGARGSGNGQTEATLNNGNQSSKSPGYQPSPALFHKTNADPRASPAAGFRPLASPFSTFKPPKDSPETANTVRSSFFTDVPSAEDQLSSSSPLASSQPTGPDSAPSSSRSIDNDKIYWDSQSGNSSEISQNSGGGAAILRNGEGRKKNRDARPLTRYLPVTDPQFDLRRHIEASGHQLEPAKNRGLRLESYYCAGPLWKMGGPFRTWHKRWFVFDRHRRVLAYYASQNANKMRGCLSFSDIIDVFVDHLERVRSPNSKSTFCVETLGKTFYLVAPSSEIMRIWVDVIFTGAEGYLAINPPNSSTLQLDYLHPR